MSEANKNTKSNFELLVSKQLNKLLKQKGKFDYLSWAHAWEMMKKFDENAQVVINEYKHYRVLSGQHQDFLIEEMKPYLLDDTGAYVSVTVTVKGISETELFPVLDFKNQAVTKPNANQINNSLKRCFVKALALHGLGLYVFQGEDIPTPPRIDTKKLTTLEGILEVFNTEMGRDMQEELFMFVNEQTDKLGLLADNVEQLEQLTYEQCALMERAIAAKRKALEKVK